MERITLKNIFWACTLLILTFLIFTISSFLNQWLSIEEQKISLERLRIDNKREELELAPIPQNWELKFNGPVAYRIQSTSGKTSYFSPFSGGWVEIIDSGLVTAPSIDALEEVKEHTQRLNNYYSKPQQKMEVETRRPTLDEIFGDVKNQHQE